MTTYQFKPATSLPTNVRIGGKLDLSNVTAHLVDMAQSGRVDYLTITNGLPNYWSVRRHHRAALKTLKKSGKLHGYNLHCAGYWPNGKASSGEARIHPHGMWICCSPEGTNGLATLGLAGDTDETTQE